MAETSLCPACAAENPANHAFCGQCGARLDTRTLTAADVRQQVEEQLDRLLTDRDVVEYMIAEAAAERVMGWAKLFAFFVGVILTILITIVGWLSFDVKQRLKEQSKRLAEQSNKLMHNDQTLKNNANSIDEMTKTLNKAQPQLENVQNTASNIRDQYAALARDIGPLQAAQRTATLALQQAEQNNATLQRLTNRVTDIETSAITCGKEAREKKAASDKEAAGITRGAHATTITALRALAEPTNSLRSPRIAPFETQVWSLDATLTSYKHEADGDYHLVLQDDHDYTIVAEIPDPRCAGESRFLDAITSARETFEAQLPSTRTFRTVAIPVHLEGIGFFDQPRGQRGMAPNGAELHPVLAITLK